MIAYAQKSPRLEGLSPLTSETASSIKKRIDCQIPKKGDGKETKINGGTSTGNALAGRIRLLRFALLNLRPAGEDYGARIIFLIYCLFLPRFGSEADRFRVAG